MALRWFNKDIWARLGWALLAIQKELQGLQPKDSSTIKWEVTETGITAHAIATAPYSAPTSAIDEETVAVDTEYAGYFKVVKASDTTVLVVDGADTANANCGYYEHGIQRIAVVKPEVITVSATGYIYVTITYTTQYIFTFAFGTTLPASSNGSIVRKLADVTFTDSKITTITQAQQGILITPGVL